MSRRALIFPGPDALVGALEARLVEAAVVSASVEFQRLDGGELAVAPGRKFTSKTWKALSSIGVEERRLDGTWQQAACWPALLEPEPVGDSDRPRSCLFTLPDEKSVLGLIAELLRLGCDRASFATLSGANGQPRALVRAFDPPYFTVIRGTGPGAPFVPFVPASAGREDVWIEYGYQHRLASTLISKDGERVLIDREGTWEAFAAPEWTDILTLANVEVLGASRVIAGEPLEEKLQVPLKLRDSSRTSSPTLWVLDDRPEEQIEKLIASVPDDVVRRLLFAVGETPDGSRRVIIRVRPGKGLPPQIDLNGTAFASHAGIANLFVPIGSSVEPPLRRDTLREHLAPDPAQVVWVVAKEGGFGLDQIEESVFAPLSDWVEYTLARANDVLTSWVSATAFATDAFVSIGSEWSAAVRERQQAPAKRDRLKLERTGRERAFDSEHEVDVAPPITVEKPSLAALPTLKKGNRSTEQMLAEIEREFLDDQAPADSPSRAEKWQLMAQLHNELGNHRDASLCLTRWLWEAPEEDVAGLASAWFLVSGQTDSLDELLAAKQAGPDVARAVISQLTGLVAADVPLPVEPSRIQQFLEDNDADLDVRTVWLGRLALSRAVGGDRLAMARSRDRILRQISGGLALDRDVPTFLRFIGAGGGDSATVGELVRQLDTLLALVLEAKRSRSPVEAPTALTDAYVRLEFAYGFARLGQIERARKLRDQAIEAIDEGDAVHSFLVRAYSARVEQAIAGKPPASALPSDVSASLNHLSKFERYKVDRLRQASTVLEPQERLDPVAAFQRGEADPRGSEFAALRGMDDPDELAASIQSLMAVAADPATSAEDRARLYDGLMDFFPMLRESDALASLGRVVAGVDSIEPPRRALLLEEALMLAGFFGREHTASELATTLDALLGQLAPDEVVGLAAEFGTCLRSLRRVGLASRAASLLERLSSAIVGEGTEVMLARLQVSGGRAFLGEFSSVEQTMLETQTAIEKGELVAADRLRLIGGLARAWTFAPSERAAEGLTELAKQIGSISDSYNTNSHFCLSVIAFVDAIVLGFAGGDLAMGDLGRRWLDEDEYLVRRRIHREMGTH